MNEEELILQYKDISSKMTDGCDNLIELKSKCLFCICNVVSSGGKEITCTKKLGDNPL